MNKHDLRSVMLDIRKNIPLRQRADASKRIVKKVVTLRQWQQASTICLYESMPTEVDTKELIALATKQKKTVIFPPGHGADLFIVPGVAFDTGRNRLGRGKGYYDRLLAGVIAPKIGLAFSAQMIAKVPRASYDVPMTAVVTESKVYENKTS